MVTFFIPTILAFPISTILSTRRKGYLWGRYFMISLMSIKTSCTVGAEFPPPTNLLLPQAPQPSFQALLSSFAYQGGVRILKMPLANPCVVWQGALALPGFSWHQRS